jgi:hypothetical protein
MQFQPYVVWKPRLEVVRKILGHVGYRVTQNAPRQTRVKKDCYAGVAFKQTWIEDKQCEFALWFLQLL